MVDELITTENVLDENTRRYYLDAMGIQCWQLLDAESTAEINADSQVEINKDVISRQATYSEINWPQLETGIQQCDKCSLNATRNQAITGRGNKTADLMFVLLSPDTDDDAAGVLCSGASGDLLTKMLSAINVAIDDVYITSLLKCAQPESHTISVAEITHCSDHLKQQIQLVQPKRLVLLGSATAQCLLGGNLPLDDLRMQCNQDSDLSISDKYLYESVPFLVSYSPDELIKAPENKRKAWADLQTLEKLI